MLEQGKRLPDQQSSRRSVVDYKGQLELSKNVWLTCRAFLVMHWRTEIYFTYIAWKKSKQAQIQMKQLLGPLFPKVLSVRGRASTQYDWGNSCFCGCYCSQGPRRHHEQLRAKGWQSWPKTSLWRLKLGSGCFAWKTSSGECLWKWATYASTSALCPLLGCCQGVPSEAGPSRSQQKHRQMAQHFIES